MNYYDKFLSCTMVILLHQFPYLCLILQYYHFNTIFTVFLGFSFDRVRDRYQKLHIFCTFFVFCFVKDTKISFLQHYLVLPVILINFPNYYIQTITMRCVSHHLHLSLSLSLTLLTFKWYWWEISCIIMCNTNICNEKLWQEL